MSISVYREVLKEELHCKLMIIIIFQVVSYSYRFKIHMYMYHSFIVRLFIYNEDPLLYMYMYIGYTYIQ